MLRDKHFELFGGIEWEGFMEAGKWIVPLQSSTGVHSPGVGFARHCRQNMPKVFMPRRRTTKDVQIEMQRMINGHETDAECHKYFVEMVLKAYGIEQSPTGEQNNGI